MKKLIFVPLFFIILSASAQTPQQITFTKEQLKDKIMGGWAGQTIAVTFGGPYEFRFNGTFIQDYQPLVWYDGYLKKTMIENPGLYDDLYMDLTFVDVFEKYGLDAPVDSFANAFAHAGYMLWHANQAARYNLLNGIKAPQSGYWINNPHADDIDYQIESDFAGLMSPGMPNTASRISDKVGHIMNYGDGWYGGVFVGAMYTQAFISNDIQHIVNEALKTIPAKSTYYQCIHDVINWHKQYPSDWHQTWFELQKKWSSENSCPDGVFKAFDIDAKLNSAYVVLALLYGNGDYTKTLKIATRCGQDADCNPSTVGGILGAMLGYEKIPVYWKMGLKEAESIDFKYTTMSLNKVYEIGYKHALENIKRNSGKVDGDKITITVQKSKTVKFEQGFTKMKPLEKTELSHDINAGELSFDFTGTGFVLKGETEKKNGDSPDYTFEVEVMIDGEKAETAKLPTNYTTRRQEICWKYRLANKKHSVNVKVLNPSKDYTLNSSEYLVYGNMTNTARN
ncbi:ADP-ribosylglycohydrolase family protein [Mucilaginibacter sp. BT774]|uniref:ADP-ribosylglycohydrolase family protein n=1 Tax=Mucilaginibacter sp. BT774 TaxID=3062276 RepID=UPI002676F85F|nr:ADP-ribosylglycohydrolase family protein [Mucilaginibacter sp. BT774]MDO3625646.1 ADP-ribosylglycohydrolase family protein [Mucilaginibacter sp. BT774]